MDQWESFPAVFFDSPIWGFGPGSGKAVSLHYTKEGKTWHSLYLLVGVETGLIGLIGLMFLLGALTRRGIAHWRTRREITDRKSTRLNSSHLVISYAVFCLKKK